MGSLNLIDGLHGPFHVVFLLLLNGDYRHTHLHGIGDAANRDPLLL